jgi:DNA-binding response OmpR family regulator
MPKRILIIEDEPHIRRMMRMTLEAAHYEVEEAADGLEGIKLFDNGSRYAAVVVDQRMPGIDGLEVLRRIKTQDSDARVVMATAYASIELAVDAMKLGAVDFVRKPTTPDVLRNAVAAAMAKRPRNQPAESQMSWKRTTTVQTVTMNGFTIVDDDQLATFDEWQRRFIVASPAGQDHEVVVEIDSEAVDYVERITGRRLGPESSFWTSQARRVLTDFLWNEGQMPPMKKLILRDLDPDKLASAARWKS